MFPVGGEPLYTGTALKPLNPPTVFVPETVLEMSATLLRKRRVLMFEDLPQEIKCEIFVRLRAVKCVVWSRCVCKSWNTLISTPCFIDAHHERNVLMRSNTARNYEYLLIGNPKKKRFELLSAERYERCLDIELPTHDVGLSFTVSGSCHGLLCISSYSNPLYSPPRETPIYLWNPSIRKLRKLPDGLIGRSWHYYIAFGFQPGENDYKVVIIVRKVESTGAVYQVEVYSLRLNSWRRINSEVPLGRIDFGSQIQGGSQKQGVYFSGAIYSIVIEYPTLLSFSSGTIPFPRCILAFDTCTEIFRKIVLPNIPYPGNDMLCIRVLEDALSVSHLDLQTFSTDIWLLEKDDTWKMHRTIPLPSQNYISSPLGFAPNGGVLDIRRMEKRERDTSYLVLYDTKGCPVKEIETNGISDFVDAYTESLILIS